MKKIFTLPIILFLCSTWSLAQADCEIGTVDGATCTFGTATDAGTWNLTIPDGFELTILVKAWGAGGGSETGTNRKSGGGGGAYHEATYTVTSADSPIAITVGAGGTSADAAGGSSFYSIGSLIVVGGGELGGNIRGLGGVAPTTGTGFDGGDGGARAAGSGNDGGGGGGGAGSATAAGTQGDPGSGDDGGAGGSPSGGDGGDFGFNGIDGGFPAGGGGGKGRLGAGAGGLGSTGGNGQVIVCVTMVLPVELVSFKANLKDDQTLLEWKTASEVNNEGFEVQKSKDAIDWDIIEFVEGNRNSSVLNTYTYIDRFPTQGSNYYRLKQMDIDGRFEYSDVVVVDFDQLKDVELFPNPAKDRMTLINGKGEAIIYNAMGQAVKQMTIDANQATIQLDDLLNGQYTIQLLQEEGTIITKQFSKMN